MILTRSKVRYSVGAVVASGFAGSASVRASLCAPAVAVRLVADDPLNVVMTPSVLPTYEYGMNSIGLRRLTRRPSPSMLSKSNGTSWPEALTQIGLLTTWSISSWVTSAVNEIGRSILGVSSVRSSIVRSGISRRPLG